MFYKKFLVLSITLTVLIISGSHMNTEAAEKNNYIHVEIWRSST